jgi:hypothetical protein
MGYKFSWQAFFASFSPYFLLFSHGHELLTSIQQDAMVIIIMCDFMEISSFSNDLTWQNIQVEKK